MTVAIQEELQIMSNQSLSDKLGFLRYDTAYPRLRASLVYARAAAAMVTLAGIVCLFFDEARPACPALIFSSLATWFWSSIIEVLLDIADGVIARSS